MQFRMLPSELLQLLLASAAFIPSRGLASPAINVALQASFNAPPYILELLLVTFIFSFLERRILAESWTEKRLQRKIRLHTFPSLTVSLKAVSPIAPQTVSYTTPSYRWCKMMDTLRTRTPWPLFNLPCLYIQLPLG